MAADSRPIGGKNLNIGVRQGLLDAKHTQAMGKAIVLYQWLICRQTKQNGLVLGGKPLTYADICADAGWAPRTVRRWMKRLTGLQYISLKHSVFGRMVIHILNQKKFESTQLPLGFNAAPPRPEVADLRRPEVADTAAKSGRLNHRTEQEHTKKENPAAKPAAVGADQTLPECIPNDAWRDYEEMRKAIKKPLTRRARELAIAQLLDLKTLGNDPKLVLEQSIFHCWQGLFPLRRTNASGTDFATTDRVLDDFRDGAGGLAPHLVETALSKRPTGRPN